jgi:hypothetical protein
MKLTLQIVIQQDDELPRVTKIASIERDTLTPETFGLSLQEAKTVLAQLQEMLVTEQVAAVFVEHETCPQCGVAQRQKGQHQIVVRSLFGKLTLASPRLYTCACQVRRRGAVTARSLSCCLNARHRISSISRQSGLHYCPTA